MVVPIWPRTTRSLKMNEDMVAANTRPAAVTTPPVPAMARMMPVLRPAPDLFLEPGYQQQVVVGPDRQQQDDGQCQHDPVQLDAEDVLPHQDRQTERCPQRQRDGADDDDGGDQAAGDEHHDEQDQGQCGQRGDHQVVLGAVLNVLVGRRGSGDVDLGVRQRGGLDRVERRVLDGVDVRDTLGGSGIALMRDRSCERPCRRARGTA